MENGIQQLEVVKMIHVSFIKGSGAIDNKIKSVNQYYDMTGKMIFESESEK